jgi:hypothetical protein
MQSASVKAPFSHSQDAHLRQISSSLLCRCLHGSNAAEPGDCRVEAQHLSATRLPMEVPSSPSGATLYLSRPINHFSALDVRDPALNLRIGGDCLQLTERQSHDSGECLRPLIRSATGPHCFCCDGDSHALLDPAAVDLQFLQH